MAEEPIRVLLAVPFSDDLVERIQAVSPRIDITQRRADDEGKLGEGLDAFEVLVTAGPLPDPEEAPKLRYVQLFWAGVDGVIEHPIFHQPEVVLCSSSGVHAINTAEFAFTLINAFARKLPSLLDHQRRVHWPAGRFELFVPQELYGATLGIVGYGSIGRHVARIAKGYGMKVLAIKRNAMDPTDADFTLPGVGDPQGDLADRIYPPEALRSFLGECDYVVLLVPLTPDTRHMLNAGALRAMKKTALLVNLSRGEVVDEEALVKALQDGLIAGAALDVFVEEPLSQFSPLWEMSNVIISPHVGGMTPHYNERVVDILVENLGRYLNGDPLVNRVNVERGY